jgi:hypothetical protein
MEISSVSTGGSAVQQQLQFSAAKAVQEQAPPQRESSVNVRAQETQTQARPSEQPERQQAATRDERQEAPRPVVNAQGQKTGTIINTTA